MEKEKKFKGKRAINNIEIVTDNKHILSVTLPLYIYYVNPTPEKNLSETVCYSKENVDFELIFKKTQSEYRFAKILKDKTPLENKNKFILDDESIHINFFKKNSEQYLTNTAKESILKYVKENCEVPNNFSEKDICFNNIIFKPIGKITYMLPSVIDVNIHDPKHRKFKIKSVLDD